MSTNSTASLIGRLEAVYDSPVNDESRCDCFKEVRQQFRGIHNDPLWTQLKADLVRELLMDDDDLRQVSEREIYEAVLKWLAANVKEIPGQIDRLLSVVRFTAMSTDEKFKCLEEAGEVGLDLFVKPYMIRADWYRTCVEMNFAEFTDLVEFDRQRDTQFVGEGRRNRAIDTCMHTVKPRTRSFSVASVDRTTVDVMERIQNGRIDAGTVLSRPRPTRLPPQQVLHNQPHRSGSLRRIPSEHLQFWRDEMVEFANTSSDEASKPAIITSGSTISCDRLSTLGESSRGTVGTNE